MEPAEIVHLLRDTLDYDQFITEDDVPSPDDSKVANIDQLQFVANKYPDIASLLNYEGRLWDVLWMFRVNAFICKDLMEGRDYFFSNPD